MNTTTTHKYYSIVSAGRWFGPAPKSYYRSLAAAQRDVARAAEYYGNVNVRIVGCDTRAQAISADIGDGYPVVPVVSA